MKKIIIEVQDDYANNVLDMLKSLKGIMIEKIKYDSIKSNVSRVEDELIKLQTDSMQKTWDNEEDRVWDEL